MPTIHGTLPVEGREFWYVQSDIHSNLRAQFRALMNVETVNQANDGGMIQLDCIISTPNKLDLVSVSFNRDLAGWRAKLKEASNSLNLRVAELKTDKLVFDEQELYPLTKCL